MEFSQLNLPEVTAHLARVFEHTPAEGVVVGRTQLRNAVVSFLGCSELAAEEIVDTLVLRGALKLISTVEGREFWHIESP